MLKCAMTAVCSLVAASSAAMAQPVVNLPADPVPDQTFFDANPSSVVNFFAGAEWPDRFSIFNLFPPGPELNGARVVFDAGIGVFGGPSERIGGARTVEVRGGDVTAFLDFLDDPGTLLTVGGGTFNVLMALDVDRFVLTGGALLPGPAFGVPGPGGVDDFEWRGGAIAELPLLGINRSRIIGGEFAISGVPVAGLDGPGASVDVVVLDDELLTGVLEDGTPFSLSRNLRLSPGSEPITLELAALPPIVPMSVASVDGVRQGVRSGEELIVDAGARMPDGIRVARGGRLVLEEGGTLGRSVQLFGGELDVFGGSFADETGLAFRLEVDDGGVLRTFGGDSDLRPSSVLNIAGGGAAILAGGAHFGEIRQQGSFDYASLTLVGGEFRQSPVFPVGSISDPHPVISLLEVYGVLADGTPVFLDRALLREFAGTFAFEPQRRVDIEERPIVGPAPRSIVSSIDGLPWVLRVNESLVIDETADDALGRRSLRTAPGSHVEIQPSVELQELLMVGGTATIDGVILNRLFVGEDAEATVTPSGVLTRDVGVVDVNGRLIIDGGFVRGFSSPDPFGVGPPLGGVGTVELRSGRLLLGDAVGRGGRLVMTGGEFGPEPRDVEGVGIVLPPLPALVGLPGGRLFAVESVRPRFEFLGGRISGPGMVIRFGDVLLDGTELRRRPETLEASSVSLRRGGRVEIRTGVIDLVVATRRDPVEDVSFGGLGLFPLPHLEIHGGEFSAVPGYPLSGLVVNPAVVTGGRIDGLFIEPPFETELSGGDIEIALVVGPAGYKLPQPNTGFPDNTRGAALHIVARSARLAGRPVDGLVRDGEAVTLSEFQAFVDRDGSVLEVVLADGNELSIDLDETTFPRPAIAGPGRDPVLTVRLVTPESVADHDLDGVVNITDLFAYIDDFVDPAGPLTADVDGNGVINISDLFAFIRDFTAGSE